MELEHIINKGETDQVIAEISAENQLKIAQHLSALANTKGGLLIIGVNHKLKVKGCEPSLEYSNVCTSIEKFLSNSIEFKTEILQEGPKLILVVSVVKAIDKMIMVSSDLGKDQVYYRKENQTILANKIIEQVLRFKLQQTLIANEDSYIKQEIEELLKERPYSLSQIYTAIEFEKKVIDATLVQLLYFQEIDFSIQDEIIQFYTKN